MRSCFKISCFFFAVLLLFACGSNKSKLSAYGEVFEKIMKTDEGVFRGTDLGMSMKDIKSKESTGLSEEDSIYLYYEIPLDTANSMTISYDFDEHGLKEIQSDIFLKNEIQFNDLLSSAKNYFVSKYGEGEKANGYWVWTVKTPKQGNIKITLTDESTDFEFSKLSLSVYYAEIDVP